MPEISIHREQLQVLFIDGVSGLQGDRYLTRFIFSKSGGGWVILLWADLKTRLAIEKTKKIGTRTRSRCLLGSGSSRAAANKSPQRVNNATRVSQERSRVSLPCFHDLRAKKNPASNAPNKISGTRYMRSARQHALRRHPRPERRWILLTCFLGFLECTVPHYLNQI